MIESNEQKKNSKKQHKNERKKTSTMAQVTQIYI